MLRFILKRMGISILVLLGVSVIAFALVRMVPGDTVTAMLGAQYSEAQAEVLREKYGLDRPVVEQYFLWLGRVVQGDLGESVFTGRSVAEAIWQRLPVTLELAGIALLFAVVVGIPLGILAAMNRSGPVDYVSSLFGLLGISIPGFWLGTLLILVFSLTFGLLPSGDFVGIEEGVLANLRHMVLPGIALGTAVAAVVMRMTRSAMLEVIGQEYITMARAKGVRGYALIVRHALKNALIPVLTILGIQAGYLLGGSVVIEQIFSLPGVGRLALQAITSRDYALLQGTILLIAGGFVLINLLVDLLYAVLDPRIRY